MVTLAAGPARMTGPAIAATTAPADRLLPRAPTPVLGARGQAGVPAAPQPARQASLSGMDAPPGMVAAATFYTPPYRLADPATEYAPMLIIPGLDPVFRTDALALAAMPIPDGDPPARRALTAPTPRDAVYVVDARGLIRPSPEGRLSPDGFTVVAGPPPVAARPRPARAEPEPGTVAVMRRTDLAADDPLRGLLPRARPEALAETRERDLLGGRTATELAGFVPKRRPASAQERWTLAAAPAAPAVSVASAGPAMAIGPRPARRDAAAIARARAAAQVQTGPAIAAADVARVPAPTPAATADRATARVGIDLAKVNLLGTFGTSGSRRALVRLPSGRVVNLSVGDRVDGGRVQEIGDGRLGYVKSGRMVTLNMPRG